MKNGQSTHGRQVCPDRVPNEKQQCADCEVSPDALHVPGCDFERCHHGGRRSTGCNSWRPVHRCAASGNNYDLTRRSVTVCQPRHQSDRNFGVVEAVPEPGGELMSAGSNPYCRGYCARPFAVAAPELGAGVASKCGGPLPVPRQWWVCSVCSASSSGTLPGVPLVESGHSTELSAEFWLFRAGRKLIRVVSPRTMPVVPVFHPERRRCKNPPKSDPAAAVVNRQASRSS